MVSAATVRLWEIRANLFGCVVHYVSAGKKKESESDKTSSVFKGVFARAKLCFWSNICWEKIYASGKYIMFIS